VSKGTNRNFDARITLEQLLALYTDPEGHNAQCHRQTDGQYAAANSRSYCVAVRSAKKCTTGPQTAAVCSLAQPVQHAIPGALAFI